MKTKFFICIFVLAFLYSAWAQFIGRTMLISRQGPNTAGGDSFTPLDSIQMWFRADDSTLTGSGDGTSISQWDDQSGNGYHVTMDDAANRPYYSNSVINGKPAISFPGQLTNRVWTDNGNAATYDRWSVIGITDGSTSSLYTILATQPPYAYNLSIGDVDRYNISIFGGQNIYQEGLKSDVKYIFYESGDTNYRDHAYLSTNGTLMTWGKINSTRLRGLMINGGDINYQEMPEGWIAELLLYTNGPSGNLSRQEQITHWNYLGDKYNFTINTNTPEYIDDLLVWLRADTATYTNNTDTTEIARHSVDSQQVGRWISAPTNYFTFEQATADNRPTNRINVINGLDTLEFNFEADTDDQLELSSIYRTESSNSTCIAVVRVDVVEAVDTMIFGDNVAANNTKWYLDSVSGVMSWSSGGFQYKGPAVTTNEWYVLTWVVDDTQVHYYTNGVNAGSPDTRSGSALTNMHNFTEVGDNGRFHGEIAEILYWPRVLSAGELELMHHNYLSNRYQIWGLQYTEGLTIWHRPETLSGANGTRVSQWDDSSGNNYHSYSLASTNEPYVTNAVLNGFAGLRFHKDDLSFMQVSNVVSGWTEAHMFMVLASDEDPPADQQETTFYHMRTVSSVGNHWPWVSGTVYDALGNVSRIENIDPSPALTSYNQYNIGFNASGGTNRINQTQLGTTTGGGTTWGTSPYLNLGAGWSGSTRYWGAHVIVEFLLYDHLLSDEDRDIVETYLDKKYGGF